MRIVIDASALLVRSAGVKNYIWHWLRALRDLTCEHTFASLPHGIAGVTALDHSRSMLPLATTLGSLARLRLMNAWTQALDREISGADIFHASNLIRKRPSRARVTTTIHDLTSWILPEFHTPSTRRADLEFARDILPYTSKILAVSASTREDMVRLLRIPETRIHVIHPGVAQEYFGAVPAHRPRPYVLFVGSIEPRKNIDGLLDAWLRLPTSTREEFDLIVAGPRGWKCAATVARIQSMAQYWGYIPEAQLPGLFAGATLFVYPSFYEGFGFPVAQAMAAGTPVIASRVSSLPEIGGDAPSYVDPYSVEDLSATMQRLLTSPGERALAVQRGKSQAKRYSWERAARESVAFFESVV